MLRKIVRFYELRYVPKQQPNLLARYDGDFWSELGGKVGALQPDDHQVGIRGRSVHGEYRTSVQPAMSYFYVGSVRGRAEWPDALSGRTGAVGPLEVRDQDSLLLEPTYVCPFGTKNQVAVLTMSGNSPRVSVLESWFTAMTGENTIIDHYSLTPILNQRVEDRLAQANGATIFRVKIDPAKEVPTLGGGQIGRAARAAKQVSSETTVELGWSLGQRKGTRDTTGELLEAARWVREDWVDSAKVSLLLPDGDRLKRKKYDLIKEQFTSTQKFEIVQDEPASEMSVMAGITKAIDEFRSEFS